MQLYVEMDPSERYGRFKDVLGKGAMKTVYRAFDEYTGTEVAWNQVKLNHVFTSPESLQRLYSEVLLLKNLNHHSIMRFRASWVDIDRKTFNFITEMFTSGTLREYRKRYKQVNIRAIKDWARQILEGLDYLHNHDPMVIHRDLKCDNIFVNGHLGQVKIGDLGFAAILHGSHHPHSVIGTPEFMAPELYEEEYDELVDIYSFGMCVLEMLTSEYPYKECSNPAQIYKKVTSGKLPQSFYHIDDEEAKRFVGSCLEKASNRPSAHKLLMDPFLSLEEVEGLPAIKISSQKADLSGKLLPKSTDMKITGTVKPQDDTIYLRVQISDKNGSSRNIYFPFDMASDTTLDVAAEMVKELEITDWEPFEIAHMIDKEISTMVPSYKDFSSSQICQQQSFDYDEDDNDDNSPHHPFYYASSFSSSQDSLPGLFSDRFYQENSLHYRLQVSDKEDAHWLSKSPKCTRFGCGASIANVDGCCLKKRHQKMVKNTSVMDMRRQLLEEIKDRRLFKTVGALEHIGYQLEPGSGKLIGGVFPAGKICQGKMG